MKTLDRQTAAFIAAVTENLPPISAGTMQHWIESKNREQLKKILGGLRIFTHSSTQLVIVSFDGTQGFKAGLAETRYKLGERLESLLGKKISPESLPMAPAAIKQRAFLLIFPSLEELGFEKPASLSEVIAKAADFGLLRCPIAAALQLCFEKHSDDIFEAGVTVAMDPIKDMDGDNVILCFDKDVEGNWIDVCHTQIDSSSGPQEIRFGLDERFAFLFPTNSGVVKQK